LEIPGEIFEKKLEGILDLTSFSNLRILDCSHNKLTSIILPDNNKLVLFFCGDNLLESLEIPRNNKIEHFDAEDNNIKSIESFKNLNPETLT
jgi:Leucine-rich repeat (LRR) protein